MLLTTNYKNPSETKILSLKTNTNKIQGKVIKIADGDTFTILIEIANNGGFIKERIRLNAIDAPEKKQPFSKKSKQFLSKLIYGKTVDIYYKKKDRYGRIIGDVYIGNLNVNYEMVKQGYAWHFKKYSDDPKLAELENQARIQRKGLWQEKDPIPPWKWRKLIRK